MENLKNKSVLIYDYGLFTEQAVRLARDFGKVYYFCHWASAFPKSNLALVGYGLEGIERIKDFWNYIDKVDIIVFPDTHCGDIVEFLRRKGYQVAGVGKAEILELDRWFGRQRQKEVGLPTQRTLLIKGLPKLREFLTKVKNKFVKLNIFRGDIESFRHIDYDSSLPLLDHLAYEVGPKQDEINFIVEDEVGEIEPGIDAIIFNGEHLSPTMYGYELKGTGYICIACPYEKVPRPIKIVSDRIAPLLKETRFFYSTEIRIDKEKRPYLIDYCMRLAAPVPSAIQFEMIENYSEVVWGLATNQKIQPIIKYKYGAGLAIESEWTQKQWAKIDFLEEIRRWVKLRMGAKFGDSYYAVPGFSSVCSVIALGNSIDEVVEKVKERAEKVKIYLADKNFSGLDQIKEEIEKGKKLGVSF